VCSNALYLHRGQTLKDDPMHILPAPLRLVSLAALLLQGVLSASVRADTPPVIDRVRIGLPTGRFGQDSGRSRNGAWAPVAVTLKGGNQGNPQGVYRLRIETNDGEELAYRYTVAVPAMSANGEQTIHGYIVPNGEGALFKVQLETTSGTVVQTLNKLTRDASKDEVIGQADILFLAVGAGLSQLKRAAEKLDKPEGKEAEIDPEAARRQFVFAEEAVLLPDRWFGLDAVDVVVLATGKREFVNQLAQDSESARRNALLEWVRRGGQLVLSVGRNKQEVAQLLQKMPLLNCKVTGSEVLKSLPTLSTQWCGREGHRQVLQQVEVATLLPGKDVHVMVRDGGRPLLLESSCGLGRVILAAFDLDGPPFTTWDGQIDFWKQLQKEVAPYLPPRPANPGNPRMGPWMPPGPAMPGMMDDGRAPEARTVLKQRYLEQFVEVPTISFGVVALFLLFYIVLVGPFDYFILKRVFKRLELTWITFPLTVIVVSVAAYATAYAFKGDEVRINKIDLVDIDLHQPRQVYGQTWFSVFSPRAQSYTLGLEPAVGTWTAPVPEGAPGPVFTLLGGGERTSRAGMQGLFPRPYDYADEATGLVHVPVPVWATRSFSASWRAPMPNKQPPIGITDDVGPIRLARDGNGLVGRLTNNLPVALHSVSLLYREKAYFIGTLEPGVSKRVETLFAGDAEGQNRPLAQWLGNKNILSPGNPLAPSGRALSTGYSKRNPASAVLQPVLFYRAAREANPSTEGNAGLRSLDQSWRLRPLPQFPIPDRHRYRDEAILVATTARLADRGEAVSDHGESPSRLWVGELPGGSSQRPPLPGILTQETYLRVFIPIQTER
jgi:hypothetical protein